MPIWAQSACRRSPNHNAVSSRASASSDLPQAGLIRISQPPRNLRTLCHPWRRREKFSPNSPHSHDTRKIIILDRARPRYLPIMGAGEGDSDKYRIAQPRRIETLRNHFPASESRPHYSADGTNQTFRNCTGMPCSCSISGPVGASPRRPAAPVGWLSSCSS